ncbi:hypothetical protein Poli38472_004038 [Pythium oligandrum]|uniref:Apple domain-containing protein n=1 Tax=Pythium oligandrum TaxID=41045 RepID=A0A8K1CNR5_PYTOL|nr:hypothetical protein Poli38472_004038 [Pythium oligandrum]|eukprot:TMW66273.1 hypothetical protein Poli38472_004038 [Pythium oligandrum]
MAARSVLLVTVLAAFVALCQGAYWLEGIPHKGVASFHPNATTYQVFRNVKDFGAKGDGVTDDTAAINAAISSGNRCAEGCDSSTTVPALVYFPSGTYVVSKPIIGYYFSQLVGDPTNKPVLKATADFTGIAVIDANPYTANGNWYFNTNNFYRAVRNFVIDLRATPEGTGIHWQVAQATQLQNIVFEMGSTQSQGVFIENGSGGFVSDLTFNGGKLGAFFGSQQFTARKLEFNGCQKAMQLAWNWVWTFKSLSINNCQIGVDMTAAGVGSIAIMDSSFTNTPTGLLVAALTDTDPKPANSVAIDNLATNNVTTIIANSAGTVLRAGSSGKIKVDGWARGYQIDYATGSAVENTIQGDFVPFQKPSSLLKDGKILERSRPQYEDVPASQFLSAREAGAKGDSKTDDTEALQKLFDTASRTGKIAFIDHGHYTITKTITIRPNTRVVGEVWANLIAAGDYFNDAKKPQPMLRVGQPGDRGVIELSDLAVMTQGPAAGAILIEWNNADPVGKQGVSGMWEVHARVGGSAGSNLQSDKCAKNPTGPSTPKPECMAAFMLMRVGKTGSVYMENNWLWTSDHELDIKPYTQVTLFAGRGFWSESVEGPIWMYGTASEHNVLYQYQFTNTKNVFMGHIQTETPYYQSHPGIEVPFDVNPDYNDPSIECASGDSACAKSWGVRVYNSKDILIAGAGLYSFFENWAQDCLDVFPQTCQTRMTSIEGKSSNIVVYNMNTVGTAKMVTVDGIDAGAQSNATKNSFSHTAVLIKAKSSSNGVPSPTPTPKPTPQPTATPTPQPPTSPTCSALDRRISYIGNDIGVARSDKATGCCDICSKYAGCKAYTWALGTCFLKSSKGWPFPLLGAYSGTVTSSTTLPPSTCVLETGIDYLAFPVGFAKSENPSGCCDKCRSTTGCKAFSWQKGVCYLKSSKGFPVKNKAVTSGRI